MIVRRLAAVVPLLAVAVLTSCGEDEVRETSSERSSAAPTSSPAAERSETPAAATSAPATSPAVSPSSAAPQWPAAATGAMHGDRVWGVYLAVEKVDDLNHPSLATVKDHAESLGYEGAVGGGDVGCDRGAAEALGIDPYARAVAVYFDSREKAEQFVALYDRPYVGYAQVTLYCLD